MSGAGPFIRDQRGAVTIEFTTLVPAFIFLMLFFVDASVIYFTHSEMFNVARDVARRMSTGQFETLEEARAYAEGQLHLGMRTYLIDPEYDGDRTVTIAIPVGQAAIFGAWFKPILGQYLVARSRMHAEPLD